MPAACENDVEHIAVARKSRPSNYRVSGSEDLAVSIDIMVEAVEDHIQPDESGSGTKKSVFCIQFRDQRKCYQP